MNRLKHIALIMDGNGRWAKLKFRPRSWGHIKGASTINAIVEKAVDLRVGALTFYAFSTENWKRPPEEIKVILKLLNKFLKKNINLLLKSNIKFDVIGDYSSVDENSLAMINELKEKTKDNKGLKLSFAFNYGGRAEIVDSVKKLIENNEKITEETISSNMYRSEAGDVDLIIRTGGDQRISNFLLWQAAYAELFFVKTLWPDFSALEFEEIVRQVSLRDRRFGGLNKNGQNKKGK